MGARPERWYVVDHERDDRILRGPYGSGETAAAVRTEMERHPQWSHHNLWVVPARDPEAAEIAEAIRVYVAEVRRIAAALAATPEYVHCDGTLVSALGYMGALDPGHDEESEYARAVTTLRSFVVDEGFVAADEDHVRSS